jgi:hypothetical protein
MAKKPPSQKPKQAVSRQQPSPTMPNRQAAVSVVASRPVADTKPAKPFRPSRQPLILSPAIQWTLSGIAVLAIGLILFRYGQFLNKDAINAPFGDDYRSTLHFLVQYLTPGTDKWKLVFEQHNEHRIVFNKLFILADYLRTGAVNFRTHILFANVSLLVIAGLVIAAFSRQNPLWVRLLWAVPVILFVFQPSYWETQIWAMASLQNLFVVAFALASLYLLGTFKQRPMPFAGACLLAFVATFTGGNGILTFATGLTWLLFTRQWKWLGIWAGVMLLTAGLYFSNYAKPTDSPDVYDSLVNNTGRAFDYLFNLLGVYASLITQKPANIGKLLLAMFIGLGVWWLYRREKSGVNPVFLLWLTFLYLTAASLMAARSGFGVSQAFSPRYGLIPVLIMAVTYLTIVEMLPKRWMQLAWCGLVGGLAFWLYNQSFNVNLLQAEDRVGQLRYNAALYANNPKDRILMPANDGKDARPEYYEEAEKTKLYSLKQFTLDELRAVPQPIDSTRLVPSGEVLADVQPFDAGKFLVVYNSWAFIRDVPADDTETFLVLRSPKAIYEVPTQRRIRFDLVNQYQQMNLRSAGFATIVRKADLPKGAYQFGVHLRRGQTDAYFPVQGGFVN